MSTVAQSRKTRAGQTTAALRVSFPTVVPTPDSKDLAVRSFQGADSSRSPNASDDEVSAVEVDDQPSAGAPGPIRFETVNRAVIAAAHFSPPLAGAR